MFAFPLVATGLALVLSGACVRESVRARSVALGVWAFALGQFAVASAALAWGSGLGWSPAVFRTYYLFGAITNVAWLGLGTVWLLAHRGLAWLATAVLIAASAWAAALTAAAELLPGAGAALASRDLVSGADVFGHEVRDLSRFLSIGGFVVVVGGLGASIVRRRETAGGLALVVAGVVVVAGVSVAARQGMLVLFSVGLAVGVALMYAGFVRSR